MMDSGSTAPDQVGSHRIDLPSAAIGGPVGRRRRAGAAVHPSVQLSSTPDANLQRHASFPADSDSLEGQRAGWLHLQAEDLISRMQDWSDQLDAREATLNARASIQEIRERQFRLRQQDAAADLAEQRRAISRMQRELATQVRRLAFRAD